jgi:hypothetical protein
VLAITHRNLQPEREGDEELVRNNGFGMQDYISGSKKY